MSVFQVLGVNQFGFIRKDLPKKTWGVSAAIIRLKLTYSSSRKRKRNRFQPSRPAVNQGLLLPIRAPVGPKGKRNAMSRAFSLAQ